MTSFEVTNPSEFNSIRQKLSNDLGKEISETEFMNFIIDFGHKHYEQLLMKVKIKLHDESPTQEQIDRMSQFIIADTEETDLSERVDEVLYR